MRVAGIDLSTRSVDIVLLADDDRADWTSVPCADRRGAFFAARLAAELMPRGTFWDDVYLVGVEDPYSFGKTQAKALGLVLGAVAACLPRRLPVIQTRPNEWQRLFIGPGLILPRDSDARKALVATACRSRGFGAVDWTQDAFDAAGIAWAVRAINAAAVGGADGAAA